MSSYAARNEFASRVFVSEERCRATRASGSDPEVRIGRSPLYRYLDTYLRELNPPYKTFGKFFDPYRVMKAIYLSLNHTMYPTTNKKPYLGTVTVLRSPITSCLRDLSGVDHV